MTLSLSRKKWNYPLIAFLIPVMGMLLIMLVCRYEPFGNYSMLYSDMYHQYYPFFVAFRNALRSGDSLLYNWNVGMGMDYLGLISYYLASPLNLLSVLVPESLLLEYFSLLMPIKLGFASLFFSIFLKRTFQKDDLSISLFGAFYGLCAWALGYQWNVMWLDTFALLPLVALGTISLLHDKRFLLYTLTLFLSIFANYYIGLFTCVFVFLIFVCYQICRWEGFGKFFADLFRIALFSVLAIGMTAILELPAYAALKSTQSSVNQFPDKFALNIADKNTWQGLLDAMRQVAGNMNGGLEPTFKEGLPNLYCGVLTNVMAFLFLTCRQVKVRDKLCSVFLLLFFNVSFVIRQLDYIWHGFHFTNMIPYRFSFLYSFVMLYMAYRAWLLRNRFRLWQVIAAGIVCIGLLLCCVNFPDFLQLIQGEISLQPWNGWDNIYANIETIAQSSLFIFYNLILLILYLAVLIYGTVRKKIASGSSLDQKRAYLVSLRERRTVRSQFLLGILALELILNLVNFAAWFSPGTYAGNYPKGLDDTKKAVETMYEREKDNLFFRAETTHSQTLNDGAINGYNGVSTFTSSANVNVTTFMKALGYGAKETYNRYCFEESSPISNLFLNLKYMLERDGKVKQTPYFNTVETFGNTILLENNAYLPLGFLANSQLINMDFENCDNRFDFQNDLLFYATGDPRGAWRFLDGNRLTINGSDVTLSSQSQGGYCSYTTDSKSGTVTYTYTADREGLFCINLDLSKKNSFTFYLNGQELYSETYSIPQMLSVSNVLAGDVVEVRLNCKANEKGTLNITAAILDEGVFRNAYAILSDSTLELTKFENTNVQGTINCNRDGVLYTSIPQDGNWSATVDGKEAEVVLIGNAMCGLILTEGRHTVSFTYRNPAFSLGWKISLGCLVFLVILYFCYYQPRIKRRKGKYEK